MFDSLRLVFGRTRWRRTEAEYWAESAIADLRLVCGTRTPPADKSNPPDACDGTPPLWMSRISHPATSRTPRRFLTNQSVDQTINKTTSYRPTYTKWPLNWFTSLQWRKDSLPWRPQRWKLKCCFMQHSNLRRLSVNKRSFSFRCLWI